jgi:hypothetical protein
VASFENERLEVVRYMTKEKFQSHHFTLWFSSMVADRTRLFPHR